MGEKTEAPTPRRRDEARAKGQGIGRSHELSMGLTLGVGTLALASFLPGVAAALVNTTKASIINMNPHASTDQLVGEAGGAILTSTMLVLPLASLILIAGVAGNLVSGGLVFSPKAVKFDMSRLNPLSGLKRIVDKQALVRFVIASAKLAILAFMSWQVVGSRVSSIVDSQGASAAQIAGTCLSAIFQLGLTITILLTVVALADWVIQRRQAQSSIKMTKDEVKQEYRESEGDPQVRGARKRRARQMAFARMMDAVPTSDVIVTNPTTLAVALKYDSLTMKAPKIVAKGQRLMAERIKQLARESNVPIIEDKPLARALFSRPIGAEVPAHLYRAVARLLVLVHQARFRGRAPSGQAQTEPQGWAPGRSATASMGLTSQPWWTAATAAAESDVVIDPADGSAAADSRSDSAAAARLYGGVSDAIVDGVAREATESSGTPDMDGADDAWMNDAALSADDVDEAALAEAMAEDELGDITPEEIAELEAGSGDSDTGEEQER
jgi:flagellar biosynthetic protein FlhB